MMTDMLDSLFGLVPALIRREAGVDVKMLCAEWLEADGTLRFAGPSTQWPHREALQVVLRGAPRDGRFRHGFSGNLTDVIDSDVYRQFPDTKAWIEAFARRRDGRVERAMIAALPPQAQVYRHADRGLYFAPRDRYHLVLQSGGSAMRIAGQEATLRQGEVWWINNKAGHESFNDSDTLRVHLIVDLYPRSMPRRLRNTLRWIYLGLRPKRFTNYWFNWPRRPRATS